MQLEPTCLSLLRRLAVTILQSEQHANCDPLSWTDELTASVCWPNVCVAQQFLVGWCDEASSSRSRSPLSGGPWGWTPGCWNASQPEQDQKTCKSSHHLSNIWKTQEMPGNSIPMKTTPANWSRLVKLGTGCPTTNPHEITWLFPDHSLFYPDPVFPYWLKYNHVNKIRNQLPEQAVMKHNRAIRMPAFWECPVPTAHDMLSHEVKFFFQKFQFWNLKKSST